MESNESIEIIETPWELAETDFARVSNEELIIAFNLIQNWMDQLNTKESYPDELWTFIEILLDNIYQVQGTSRQKYFPLLSLYIDNNYTWLENCICLLLVRDSYHQDAIKQIATFLGSTIVYTDLFSDKFEFNPDLRIAERICKSLDSFDDKCLEELCFKLLLFPHNGTYIEIVKVIARLTNKDFSKFVNSMFQFKSSSNITSEVEYLSREVMQYALNLICGVPQSNEVNEYLFFVKRFYAKYVEHFINSNAKEDIDFDSQTNSLQTFLRIIQYIDISIVKRTQEIDQSDPNIYLIIKLLSKLNNDIQEIFFNNRFKEFIYEQATTCDLNVVSIIHDFKTAGLKFFANFPIEILMSYFYRWQRAGEWKELFVNMFESIFNNECPANFEVYCYIKNYFIGYPKIIRELNKAALKALLFEPFQNNKPSVILEMLKIISSIPSEYAESCFVHANHDARRNFRSCTIYYLGILKIIIEEQNLIKNPDFYIEDEVLKRLGKISYDNTYTNYVEIVKLYNNYSEALNKLPNT